MVTKMKPWMESASLIVTAKIKPKLGQSHDYNVLFLKRQSDGCSYGDIYVFSGGMIDPSDADLKWQSLFKKFGYNGNSYKSVIPMSKLRPEIYRSAENELPREVSLRISAIRETFDECGILHYENARAPFRMGLSRLKRFSRLYLSECNSSAHPDTYESSSWESSYFD